VLQQRRESTLFRLLASRFRNPLVILLVAASVIAALTGDVRSCAVITAMIVFSVLLDSVQEHRAGQAAERLRQSVAVRVTARRATSRILPDPRSHGRRLPDRSGCRETGVLKLARAGMSVPSNGLHGPARIAALG
jgi:hypothetical protein